MPWWRRHRPAAQRHHAVLGELTWNTDAWHGTIELRRGEPIELAIVAPEVTDAIVDALAAATEGAATLVDAATHALLVAAPELASHGPLALEAIAIDSVCVLELHLGAATWPDAMLRVRVAQGRVVEVAIDD